MKKLFIIAALLGCAGTNPAVAPAPFAEIPGEFSVPESVGVDLSVGGSGSGSGLGMVAGLKFGTLAGDFSEVIALGIDTAADSDNVLDGLLFPFTHFTIPVDPTVKVFEATVQEGDGLIPTQFKIDFADYDFDGDGDLDGFPGCTCPVGCAPQLTVCPDKTAISDIRPIGFRIWIKRDPAQPFQRVMAGFFDVLPVKADETTPENEENPGKGTFRIGRIDGSFDMGIRETLFVGVSYDHRDPASPLNQTTENKLMQEIAVSETQIVIENSLHTLVSRRSKSDPAKKSYLENTIRTRLDAFSAPGFEDFEGGTEFEAYMGRFRNDADFWSGSLIREITGEPPRSVPATCARISTGEGLLLPDICVDLDIDTSDQDVTKGQFFPEVTEAEVAFPADFPPDPTF